MVEFLSLESVVSNSSLILVDAFGVFWGGEAVGLLPGALATFQKIKEQNTTIIIVSNSTRLTAREVSKYSKAGLYLGEHYDLFVSSGQITRDAIVSCRLPFSTPRYKYWLYGDRHPQHGLPSQELFENSLFSVTSSIEDADFIYCGIPHKNGCDQESVDPFREKIEALVKTGLVMLIANPDKTALEGRPSRPVVRQGSIGALYQEAGGKVCYFGKPYPLIFEYIQKWAVKHLGLEAWKDAMIIGDNCETDICGGNQAGINTALITDTGVATEPILTLGIEKFLASLPMENRPKFLVSSFSTGV
ncbi:MAG: TIGR01459 family HAD-type hydrolase [Nostoc desertorum CM1-VF14]|jgi:HAD superfamily hydrolase (TIGR01459 family)|nr:TIGR01459 family HAD-type hydrolase [Nostoc desertorum CM1-VF14]